MNKIYANAAGALDGLLCDGLTLFVGGFQPRRMPCSADLALSGASVRPWVRVALDENEGAHPTRRAPLPSAGFPGVNAVIAG